MNDEFRINYDQEAVKRKTENSIREESYSKGIEQGFEQGIEQGSKNKQEEIAKNLLDVGTIDVETISKTTGLTIDEINNLK